MLADKIKNRQSGIVLYGITPPKKNTAPERIAEIAQTQVQRLQGLPLDGLIVYDIQDEALRTEVKRPFPFLETLDGEHYCEEFLTGLTVPKVIYRSVGKYSPEQLTTFLNNSAARQNLTVFVGAASREQAVTLSMKQAYQLKADAQLDVLLGGVTIPE